MCVDVCWGCVRSRKGMRKESHIKLQSSYKILESAFKKHTIERCRHPVKKRVLIIICRAQKFFLK